MTGQEPLFPRTVDKDLPHPLGGHSATEVVLFTNVYKDVYRHQTKKDISWCQSLQHSFCTRNR